MTLAHHRLLSQRIDGVKFKAAVEAVSWLCAVQAQDFAGAKWALGLRLDGAKDAEVEQAFNRGEILRTHLLRPTWHFVAPADIRWILLLTAVRVHAVNAGMYRQVGLDEQTVKRSQQVLVERLKGGQYRRRDELREAFQQAGIQVDDNLRLAYIMMHAELEGLVCSGPRQGKQFTYALLEERAPHTKTVEREEALAELARRYFISRGPATVNDFSKWSGLTVAEANSGLGAVNGQLQSDRLAGQVYWFAPVPSVAQTAPHAAHLLSIYDEYISGYKDRSAMVNAEVGEKLMSMGNALVYIIVVDGQVVGTWRRTFLRSTVVIETNLMRTLTDFEHKAVVEAVKRYGDFLGLIPVLKGDIYG